MIVPVILSGGSGSRLWPFSREFYPKQFMRFLTDKTMLQDTLLRFSDMEGLGAPVIMCNEAHRFIVAEQLRTLDMKTVSIIVEPVIRNTAPAAAVAALMALSRDPASILLMTPADHHIADVSRFQQAMRAGESAAERGYLVTFGVTPQSPETGYGYIQKGQAIAEGMDTGNENAMCPMSIRRFAEKPDRATAQSYIESGDYFWNSGIFMFRASTLLNELEHYAPDILDCCRTAFESGKNESDFFRLDPKAFAACRSDSLDYAVMEKTTKGAVIPLESDWSDLGSWHALWEIGARDADNNVQRGNVLALDTHDCLIDSAGRLVAAVGVKDLVIIETSDAVLVADRHRSQDVKLLVEKLKSEDREEALQHKEVFRPWGSYEGLDMAHNFQVKRITVRPGAKLSLQKHKHRSEHWTVVSGEALVTRDQEEHLLIENQSIYIPLGAVHRLENPGAVPLILIEVQCGTYLGEDDIVRFEDVYGREDS